MRVGLDLDGVLYNFGDSCKRYLDHIGKGHLWKSGPTPDPYWEWYKDWGWSSDEFVQFCNDGVDAGFIFSGPTRPGATEAVDAVVEQGHEIIIITDRQFGSSPINSHRATADWLEEHQIWFDELWFSADKTCTQTDIFIEDKWQNAVALEAAGTPCVLINRPWNKDYEYHWRIDDVTEYPRIVKDFSDISVL
jgi:FMN phosphatase YigB (HAD superfamily)